MVRDGESAPPSRGGRRKAGANEVQYHSHRAREKVPSRSRLANGRCRAIRRHTGREGGAAAAGRRLETVSAITHLSVGERLPLFADPTARSLNGKGRRWRPSRRRDPRRSRRRARRRPGPSRRPGHAAAAAFQHLDALAAAGPGPGGGVPVLQRRGGPRVEDQLRPVSPATEAGQHRQGEHPGRRRSTASSAASRPSTPTPTRTTRATSRRTATASCPG